MVASTYSRSGSGYKFDWRGATVKQQVSQNVQAALDSLAQDVLSYLHSTLHVKTGQMNDEAFAEVKLTGGKRTLSVGSDAPHTLFHELRYHPQFRETLDIFAPKVTQYLQAAFRA